MPTASLETTLELWSTTLRQAKHRIRPLFAAPSVAASANAFLDGLLGAERRKTGWMRAEAAGDPGPWRQQAILGRSHWNADALRDVVRDHVIETLGVDSSGRRNTAYVTGSKELVQSLGRCSPAQGFEWPAIEGRSHGCKVLGAVHAEVGALRKVLPQQPVGVLVRAALPGAVGIAEVDRHARRDPELGVLGHLRAPIPRQRSSQLVG